MDSGHGIHCNATGPATIVTPMIAANMRSEGMNMESMAFIQEHVTDNVPVNMPEDVAATLLFFAFDGGKNITGQAIVCDFGYTL